MAAVGIAFKGDFAKLLKLREKVDGLTKTKYRTELSKVMGAEALKLVQTGFRSSTDPYGAAWAPLKHRNGKPLLDSGRLRSSFSAQSDVNGFRIGTNVSYAKFHQYGTSGRKKASTQRRFTGAGGRFISKVSAISKGNVAKSRAIRDSFHNDRQQRKVDRLSKHLERLTKRDSKGRKKSGPVTQQHRAKAAVATTKKAKLRGQIKAIRTKMAARAGARTVVGIRFLNFKAGGGKIPARMMLPDHSLPDAWRSAFEVTSKRFFSRLMRGK